MRHTYFLSHDGFVYRRSAEGKTSYSGKSNPRWEASMYFSRFHNNIQDHPDYKPISRDAARKRHPSLFRA